MSTLRIATVRARWHADLLDHAARGLREGLAGSTAEITERVVPGALEIPLQAQRLALAGDHDAVVAMALVVDGGIYRHEFVAQAVLDGIVRVSLDTDVPVLSMVLTPHHFHEHETHHAFFADHLETKGRETAEALELLFDAER